MGENHLFGFRDCGEKGPARFSEHAYNKRTGPCSTLADLTTEASQGQAICGCLLRDNPGHQWWS